MLFNAMGILQKYSLPIIEHQFIKIQFNQFLDRIQMSDIYFRAVVLQHFPHLTHDHLEYILLGFDRKNDSGMTSSILVDKTEQKKSRGPEVFWIFVYHYISMANPMRSPEINPALAK